jgi:hypothetical protein
MTSLKLFETKQVRSLWDAEREVWFFSIVDVVAVLTDSADAAAYWRKLKQRLKAEGNETVTNCHGLKMQAPDGKMRLTAGNTRKEIEEKTGKPVVSAQNAKRLK